MNTSAITALLRRGCVGLLVGSQLLTPTAAAAATLLLGPESDAAQPAAARRASPLPEPRVRVNRTVPTVAPRPVSLTFSENPGDQEFYDVRIFREPLVPIGATSPAENRELARALEAWQREGRPESGRPVLEFLLRRPASAWRPSLMANLAGEYYEAGYFSRALRSWDAAWRQTKGDTTPMGRALADFALGKWFEAMTQIGHLAPLKARLAEIADRDVSGPATVHIEVARQSVWFLENRHHEAIASGPGALDRLMQAQAPDRAAHRTPDVIAKFHATAAGISLTELQALGRAVGRPLQMAWRPAGAPVVVPSIVHFGVDHFAAVVQVEGDRYLLSDATLGNRWVTRAMLDEEGSGYALVPLGPLPAQWRPVQPHEGKSVFGKCRARISFPSDDAGPPRAPTPPNRPCVTGMAAYSFHPVYGGVQLHDTPVGYRPPRGPAAPIELTYNELDATTSFPWHANFGNKWTFSLHAYISEEGWGANVYAPWYVSVYMRGGGKEHYNDTYAGMQSTSGSSRARLYRTPGGSPVRYERHLPDGTIEVYGQSDSGPTNRRKVLLTELIDPSGQKLTLTYDTYLRIVGVTDAIGQVTTFSYDHPTDMRKITKVTDPFGRAALFEYSGGRLVRIVDTMGMASSFAYQGNDSIRALTTPYGTTTFNRQFVGGVTSLEITDAAGAKERFEYHDLASDLPATAPVAQVPTGFGSHNAELNRRVSLFWDKRAWALHPGDKSKAVITKWLQKGAVMDFSHDVPTTISVPASVKRPLEHRLWFAYPGQTDPQFVGWRQAPSQVARTLDDGSSQIRSASYNDMGRPTSVTDPLGRSTSFTYASNLLDVLEVRQTTGGADQLLATLADYTAGHTPQLVTDAAGQQTAFTYNAFGQLTTILNAKSETTTFSYTDGYLMGVSGPLSANVTFTYDGYGRVRTATDVDGYTTTTDYDLFDRPVRVTYPDGSYEQMTYTRLNVTEYRDRSGRVTRYFYDPLGRLTSMRDPAGRTVSQEWCRCGSLDSLTDAKGQKTTWERDIQSRVTRELRADGATQTLYTYETATSRLKQVTDPKLQVTTYSYALDDALTGIAYTNAAIATPSVTYTYDAVFPRLATMVDGTGTTAVAYHAVGGLGAGRLASVDGPLTNDVIGYTYDQLGRVTSRSINGVSVALTYDALGRVTQEVNALGTFAYGYAGATQRLASVDYPNGQSSLYAYRPNLEDRRLETIHHKRPGGATLSRFDFTYDVDGQILTKTQQADSDAPTRWSYAYDRADQLTEAVHRTTGGTPTELARYVYGYDAAGNRTSEQIDDSLVTATHDALNRLQTHVPGGALRVGGTTSEPATVNVQSKPMAVHADQTFSGTAAVTSGTNTLTVSATDANGNTATRTYEVDVTGAGRTFTYDANGNLTSDGVRTFEWDAADRLVAIDRPGERLEMTHNGFGQKTAMKRLTGVVTVTHQLAIWSEGRVAELREQVGNVTTRFHNAGVQEGAGSFLFTRDHLGSVTEVMEGTVLRGRHAFDAFGRRTRISGDRDAELGFAGLLTSADPHVMIATFRDYDSGMGRWLSRDPLGDIDGPNMYAYVGNNPINLVDPLGLYSSDQLLYDLAQISAGFGDVVSMGLTDMVRDWNGTNDVIDKCSPEYGAGKAGGVLHGMLMAGAGLTRAGLRVEMGNWKQGGQWVKPKGESALHFHWGKGPGLQDHHLPHQAGNWARNFRANVRRGVAGEDFGSGAATAYGAAEIVRGFQDECGCR